MDAHQRDKRIEELFQIAAEISRDERPEFFRRHCGDDPEMRSELETLLEQDDEGTKDFLLSPVLSPGTTSSSLRPGTEGFERTTLGSSLEGHIGPYRIIEKIGEGGMATVYLAEQSRPVHRNVALKIVKLGMDTERVVARFEVERLALAMMDHPCIARIYDGGATRNGRPYFVMEYVNGRPIIEYCDAALLGVRDRLELYCRVCDAIQHAHQKGIIHRDLKPSNILVTQRDGAPTPIVIDFGIARATTEASVDVQRQTRATEVIGTCYYMSPEQADPRREDIDTRTDIYSLGVLLYEMLTGALPFDADTMKGKTLDEVRDILRDTEPDAPSMQVARLGDTTAEVAQHRGVDARTLVRHLRGDLDWITMKALEKDRARRYGTASELAGDVRRYLRDESVLARPPDLGYRFAKFVRRNRVAVLSGTIVVIALVTGIIGTTLAMIEASHQRDEAVASADKARDAERDAREAEQRARNERRNADEARRAEAALRKRAEEETLLSRSVTDFLVDTVSLADPEISLSNDVSLYRVLRRAGEKVGLSFEGYPMGEVALRGALGRAFHSVGELELAETHLQRALEIQQGSLEASQSEVYDTMWRLGQVYRESDSRKASDLVFDATHLGINVMHESHPELAEGLQGLLHLVTGLHLDDKAMEYFADVNDAMEEELPPGDPLWVIVANTHEFLGTYLSVHWDREEAATFLEASLSIRRRELPPIHPDIAKSLTAIVAILNQHGLFDRAETLVHESIEIYTDLLPENHWLIAAARSLLGECLSGKGQVAEAEQILNSSHDAIVASRGPVSRATIESSYRLVRHYERTGQEADAQLARIDLARGLAFAKNPPWGWSRHAAAFGPEHAELVTLLEDLDVLATAEFGEGFDPDLYLRRYETLSREILTLRRATLPEDHLLAVVVARLLSNCVPVPVVEAPILENEINHEILAILDPHRGLFPGEVADALMGIGFLALPQSPEEAEAHFREALRVYRDVFGNVLNTVIIESRLAHSIFLQGRHQDIEPQLIRTWKNCVERLGVSHEVSLSALGTLISLYDSWGHPREAGDYIRQHLEGRIANDVNPLRLYRLSFFAVRSEGFPQDLYRLARRAAVRAIELDPADGDYEEVLGMAQYRLAEYEESAASFDRAEVLDGSLTGAGYAFLAMTSHRLGQEADARVAMQRLEELLASHAHREDQRLAGEARAVLGVPWARDEG